MDMLYYVGITSIIVGAVIYAKKTNVTKKDCIQFSLQSIDKLNTVYTNVEKKVIDIIDCYTKTSYKDLEIVSNNLIFLAAAYNGGPGNLKKWKKETNYLDDPLFFMESIPSRETRWFIEKILTKYWIYQNKNKKNMTSLKMLANGQDPLY